MEAASGAGSGGDGLRCRKTTAWGIWMLNMLAFTGENFCEKHIGVNGVSGEDQENKSGGPMVHGEIGGVVVGVHKGPEGSVNEERKEEVEENGGRYGSGWRKPEGLDICRKIDVENEVEAMQMDSHGGRKRGRPKGSKNKGKKEAAEERKEEVEEIGGRYGSGQWRRPEGSDICRKIDVDNELEAMQMDSHGGRKRGRPNGSKNRDKNETAEVNEERKDEVEENGGRYGSDRWRWPEGSDICRKIDVENEVEEMQMDSHGGRKRGRPKGSKNRDKKEAAKVNEERKEEVEENGGRYGSGQWRWPEGSDICRKIDVENEVEAMQMDSHGGRKRVRPKGSKNREKKEAAEENHGGYRSDQRGSHKSSENCGEICVEKEFETSQVDACGGRKRGRPKKGSMIKDKKEASVENQGGFGSAQRGSVKNSDNCGEIGVEKEVETMQVACGGRKRRRLKGGSKSKEKKEAAEDSHGELWRGQKRRPKISENFRKFRVEKDVVVILVDSRGAKKRGRPKGSQNKEKQEPAEENYGEGSKNGYRVDVKKEVVALQVGSQVVRKRGRPKGSKDKVKKQILEEKDVAVNGERGRMECLKNYENICEGHAMQVYCRGSEEVVSHFQGREEFGPVEVMNSVDNGDSFQDFLGESLSEHATRNTDGCRNSAGYGGVGNRGIGIVNSNSGDGGLEVLLENKKEVSMVNGNKGILDHIYEGSSKIEHLRTTVNMTDKSDNAVTSAGPGLDLHGSLKGYKNKKKQIPHKAR